MERPSLNASLYRCSECGDGEHLTACFQAVATGPVAADGSLGRLDDCDDCFVFEDSIQCPLHPCAYVEKFVDGVYTRPAVCPDCGGHGHRPMYQNIRCEQCAGLGFVDSREYER